MEKKVIEFYRRCIFGSNYKSNANKNKRSNNICSCCFNNAWRDMARTFAYKNKKGSKDFTAEQNARKILKQEMLNFLINQVKKKKFSAKSFIKAFYNREGLTVGQLQKVCNMFFKYLYTFLDEECLNLTIDLFSSCDCPIDKIIINKLIKKKSEHDKLFNKFKLLKLDFCKKDYIIFDGKEYAWSKIDNIEVYQLLQQLIASLSTSKLDFDFTEWE